MTDDLQAHEQYVIDVVKPLQRGTLLSSFADQLQQAIGRVESLQKSAKMTLTINIRPESNGQFSLTGEVTSKLPTATPSPTAFFLTTNGTISNDDPQQMTMDDVVKFTPPARNVRSFDIKTGEVDDD